jgi:RNA polymerase sigma-70 factor (ECF subfamily)
MEQEPGGQVSNELISDPDVALMLRVKEDDAVAFELLVDRFQRKIIRFMNGWTRSAEQAEDLAQEVFLRIYKSRKTYLPTAKFSTWLYRIAHNVASNHVRDVSVRREYQLSKAENGSTSGLLLENIAFLQADTNRREIWITKSDLGLYCWPWKL